MMNQTVLLIQILRCVVQYIITVSPVFLLQRQIANIERKMQKQKELLQEEELVTRGIDLMCT